MNGKEYREKVRKITRAVIRKHIPRLQPGVKRKVVAELAALVHANLYGCEVDSVQSPVWRDIQREILNGPTAEQILAESESDETPL